MSDNLKTKKIIAQATDPVYIGTGGFTLGRVDNTIVRDPITKIPKIPGSSIAGTWRYYMALELQSSFNDDYKQNLSKRKDKSLEELFNTDKNWIKNFDENRYARIKCAGQDDTSYLEIDKFGVDEEKEKIGHCGHCIVCKSFGYSKQSRKESGEIVQVGSSQGMLFFSDLNILFFPVYTRLGVRWITSCEILKRIDLDCNIFPSSKESILTFNGNEGYLNLGWLNLQVENKHNFCSDMFEIDYKRVVVVSDEIISQIINSNLEVRTSVSIDPITGTAKEGALFTSEAIPRGTIFYGEVRGFKREGDSSLPELNLVFNGLEDSKQYFNTLGIGGMTTRGFGRLEVKLQ